MTLTGRDFYLGKWKSKASRIEYTRLIGEWLAAGRCVPKPENDFTVAELCLRYLRFAEGYVKDGRPTGSLPVIRVALRHLRESYGYTLAKDFGPLALEALQGKLIAAGLSRNTINEHIACIRRAFKWAVAKQLVAPSVHQSLACLPGLRQGRSAAREPEPVRPVDDATVDATLPLLPAVVADMVRFQRLCGARPAEVCHLRPCDVDTRGHVWLYRPQSHKTEHFGRDRVIAIGPRAQDVLRPYLLRDKTAYCFVPAESERKRREAQHAARVTPLFSPDVVRVARHGRAEVPRRGETLRRLPALDPERERQLARRVTCGRTPGARASAGAMRGVGTWCIGSSCRRPCYPTATTAACWTLPAAPRCTTRAGRWCSSPRRPPRVRAASGPRCRKTTSCSAGGAWTSSRPQRRLGQVGPRQSQLVHGRPRSGNRGRLHRRDSLLELPLSFKYCFRK